MTNDVQRLVCRAAELGDADQMRKLLSTDASAEPVRAQPSSPSTSAPSSYLIPLFCAAEGGNAECIRLLLDAGADLMQRDNFGRTALFYARTPAAVRTLVEAGIDVDVVDEHGDDALDDLLEYDLNEVDDTCRALIECGIPIVRFCQRYGNSRLYKTAFRQNFDGVQFLLDVGHPVDSDTTTTALHAICWHPDYGDDRDDALRALILTLLGLGINPNRRLPNGNTSLHEAIGGDGENLVAAEALLAAGADVNAVNEDGETPLLHHFETQFGYRRVVPFLLEHGANPLIADRRGQNAVDAARRMIAGQEPMWRQERFANQGGPPCLWKDPAQPDDDEYETLSLLEKAAERFDRPR